MTVIAAQKIEKSNWTPISSTSKGPIGTKEHHAPEGGFVNPWNSFSPRGFKDLFSWLSSRKSNETAIQSSNEPALETVPLDITRLSNFYNNKTNGSKMLVSWLGHAAMWVTVPRLNVLFDPCFSERCSPLSFAGPKRLHPNPFQWEDLPQVDVIVLSHNHYDHTDLPSLKRLVSDTTTVFVPLGLKDLLTCQGFQNVIECDWWDEFELQSQGANVKIACTPAQHFSSRGLFDRNKTLWSSWVLKTKDASFFFAGDTGYRTVEKDTLEKDEVNLPTCPAFKKIGDVHGPFDIAAIPIGAYEPRWFMSPVHCNPWDAVCLHKDIKSNRSIGMHWGTFLLADEPSHEPPIKLKEALKREGLSDSEFHVLKIGESIAV